MWNTKTFKTKEAMKKWIIANDRKTQWQEIFLNNAYGVEFKPLRKVY
jgi:hypothetical protein